MKRQTQFTGIRNWYGPDLLSLQEEPLKVLDRFFGDLGSFIISGCKITQNGTKYDISEGIVVLEGPGPDDIPTKIVAPFDGVIGIALPVYLSLTKTTEEAQYRDGEMKPVSYDYRAIASSVKPSGNYITITSSGGPRLADVLQDASHRFISDTERTFWNAKESTTGSQAKADGALVGAKNYTDTRETAMRTDMASWDSSTLASAKGYADTQKTATLNEVANTYAKIASPTFTGTPTAPTPTDSTNSTRLATTAFVHALGEKSITISNFDTFNPYGSLSDRNTGVPFTLEIGQSCAFYSSGATGRPAVDGYSLNPSVWTGRVYRASTYNFVVEAIGYYSGSSRYPIRATRSYYATSASSVTPYSWEAESEYLSASSSGYVKFPSGLMIQWGTRSGSSTGLHSITFPISFTQVFTFGTNMEVHSATTNALTANYYSLSTTSVSVRTTYAGSSASGISAENFKWFAIGTWR